MWMVAAYRRTYRQSCLAWSEGWQPPGAQSGTLKMRDMNLRHQLAMVEIARHKNSRNAIVWNTECCICLSIAEQECMGRQERAPDFCVFTSLTVMT